MNADGSGQRNLTRNPEEDDYGPNSWPDGRKSSSQAIGIGTATYTS